MLTRTHMSLDCQVLRVMSWHCCCVYLVTVFGFPSGACLFDLALALCGGEGVGGQEGCPLVMVGEGDWHWSSCMKTVDVSELQLGWGIHL